MMEMPLGFRVSGAFGTKAPILMEINISFKEIFIVRALRGLEGPLRASLIMRGDYYVVPPNGARIHTCVRTLLRIAPAGAPEGLDFDKYYNKKGPFWG